MRLLLPLALLFALAQAAAAQTPAAVQAPVDARRALTSLPDSQAVLYIDARRIINQVLPKMMPPADYQKMLNEAQKVGFDARGIEYVAIGARLADPAPANNLPDFVIVVRGNFNADTMLAIGRLVAGGNNVRPRSETYGSKTIEILDLQSMSAPPEAGANGEAPKQSPMLYPELAVTALDSNTLVAGVPSYVRAAVDAAGGRGGLKSTLVELAARDPQSLWSLTVELPPDLYSHLRKVGAPASTEAEQMFGWVKQVNLAQGMDALNYTLSASVLTDAPEHASAFSGLVRMGLLGAQTALNAEAARQTPAHKDYARTRAALDTIKTFVNRTEGNTLILRATASQKAVAELIKQEFAPAKPAAKPAPKTPRRRGRRR